MTLAQLIAHLNDDKLNKPANATTIVYQGKGFNGTCAHDDSPEAHWTSTHCWSPVAAKGTNIHVWAKAGTPLTEEMFNEYIEFLKDISPNVRRNIELLPPTRNPLRFHFHDDTDTTGYPQYYAYVLWKNTFANPKGVPFMLYLKGLGYDIHECFYILMTLTQFWYTPVYGGRILESGNREVLGTTYKNLQNVDELPHTGNYCMRGTVTANNFALEGVMVDTMVVPPVIKSVNDLTKENLDVLLTVFNKKEN